MSTPARSASGASLLAALVFAATLACAGCGDLEESDLTTGTGTVEGTVRDAGGQPLAAARVFVQDNLALYATTDAAGAFRLASVPAGARRILAYTEVGLGASADVTVLAGEVATAALVMAPAGTVSGGVTLAGATDHVGTLVYLLGTSFAAYTDHGGAFVIHFVVPGCYVLRAEHDGFAPKEVGPLCVLAGGARVVGEFTLAAGDAPPCAVDAECPPHQLCVENRCIYAEGFQAETCNGRDDDGDGLVDEGLVALCGVAEGACEPGGAVCLGGDASPCFGAIGPRDETCDDGVDEDCDGATDEGCAVPCGDGVCAAGEDAASCPADCPRVCGECPVCAPCVEELGECVALPCVDECDTAADCGAGAVCTAGPDGCCGRCEPDPCVGLECVATCASDPDCAEGDVCVATVPGCCTACSPACPDCAAQAGAWCAGEPPNELCELGTIALESLGACWFRLTYTGEDGVDVVTFDACDDWVGNLPVNACGVTYVRAADELRVACNWCGEVVYTRANCGGCLAEGAWQMSGQGGTCCPGLTPLRTTASVIGGRCEVADCGAYAVCAACGDGVCGVGESFCTCPDDCHATCVEAGGVMVGEDGCCAGEPALTALPLGDSLGCLLFACAACGDGTCGYGETPETCAADCCQRDCAGRECGDDGCGGSCGTCDAGCSCSADGQCEGGSESETLSPDCVHAPPIVRADFPFAVAVYGTTTGCTTFDLVTATVTDDVIDLAVHGSTSTCGPCPACLWSYVGMAYVSVPGPGTYTLRVNGGVHGTIAASAGGVIDPACQVGCVPLETEGWTLTFSTQWESSVACGGELSEPASISGACQDYALTSDTIGVLPDTPIPMFACTEDLFLFGDGDPRYVQGTRCTTGGGPAAEVILGIANYGLVMGRPGPRVFVLERY